MLSWSFGDLPCDCIAVQLWRSYLCFSLSRTESPLSPEQFVPRDARFMHQSFAADSRFSCRNARAIDRREVPHASRRDRHGGYGLIARRRCFVLPRMAVACSLIAKIPKLFLRTAECVAREPNGFSRIIGESSSEAVDGRIITSY